MPQLGASAGDTLVPRLRERCRDAITTGSRLPPEPVLAAELGVSRPLLREALARLEHEGLLRRRRGEATSVNVAAQSIEYWFDRQETFADLLRRQGLHVEHDVLDVGWRRVEGDDVPRYAVAEGSHLLAVRKRWRADGRVVMVADNFVPLPEGVEPDDVDDPARNVFELVSLLRGEAPEWEIARPTAVLVDAMLAGQLEVDVPAAALVLDLLGLSVSGVPLYRSVEHHVPGAVDWAFVRTFLPG